MVVSNSSSLMIRPDRDSIMGHKMDSHQRSVYYPPECRRLIKKRLSRWRRRDHQRFIEEALDTMHEQAVADAEWQHQEYMDLWGDVSDDWNAYEASGFRYAEDYDERDSHYEDFGDVWDDPYLLDWDNVPETNRYAKGYKKGYDNGYNEGFAAAVASWASPSYNAGYSEGFAAASWTPKGN